MPTTEVKVPDIGDFKDVPVIEVFVKVGDTVKAEDPLVSLESDKATMDVPSPSGGTVKSILVNVGDKVSEGSPIVVLESSAESRSGAAASSPPGAAPKPSVAAPPAPAHAPQGIADVRVPDIGDFKDVPVIEILVKPGDTVQPETPLVTLESDKATMDVPAPLGGVVRELKIDIGDRVSEGTVILTLATGTAPQGGPSAPPSTAAAPVPATAGAGAASSPGAPSGDKAAAAPAAAGAVAAFDERAHATAYAGPAVRKLARELDVDLGRVQGSGDRGRITRADVEAFARGGGATAPAAKAAPSPAGGGVSGTTDLLPWPKVDFAKFGPVRRQPLSRIRKISGANLHRNWVMIPHVTNHDEADITELEAFRVQMNKENEKSGVRVSMLAFLIKAVVYSLKKFPEFNSSLEGDELVMKDYWHIGFAADTPNGLVVPVVRDADRKGVLQIAKEMAELAALAREGKLKPDQMQGGTFTISSLGGIGGIFFTPIINAPEVSILGVCRSYWKQVSHDGRTSAWRFVLPLSLSWDHRVIDGAAAARFNAHLAGLLGDLRRIVM